jgi:hypothetical protein
VTGNRSSTSSHVPYSAANSIGSLPNCWANKQIERSKN